MIRYDGRAFEPVSNSSAGDVSSETRFFYRQSGDVVWATYEGGSVRFGTLVAKVDEHDVLDMRYQHVSAAGELKTGTCRSVPELLEDGRLRLHESWRWTSGGEGSGSSVVEEVAR